MKHYSEHKQDREMKEVLLAELYEQRAKQHGTVSRLVSARRYYSIELQDAIKECARLNRHISKLEREAKEGEPRSLRQSA